MFPTTEPAREVTPDSPLSSAILRYSLRPSPSADGPGPHETRPFGLRFARTFPTPAPRPVVRYCHQMQLAVGDDGRPLIERWDDDDDHAKKWKSKDTTDGDEGPEESIWEWEEQ